MTFFAVTDLSARASNKNQDNFYLEFFFAQIENLNNRFYGDELIKTKKDLQKYAAIIDKRYIRYLKIITDRLNFIHNTKNNSNYWSLALSLGFVRYVTVMYYFYEKYRYYFDPKKFTFNTLSKTDFIVPIDFENQRDLISNTSIGREQIFSIYYKSLYSKHAKSIKIKPLRCCKPEIAQKNIRNTKLHKNLISLITKLIGSKNPNTLILGCAFKFNLRFKILLNPFSNIKIITLKKKYPLPVFDSKKRNYLSRKEKNFDEFDIFFFNSLKTLFPMLYVENFKYYEKEFSDEINNFPRAKNIFSEQFISDSYISLFLAECRKRRIKINAVEHNGMPEPFVGHYNKYIINLVDKFYTYGERIKGEKIVSSSSLHSYKLQLPKFFIRKKYKILLIFGQTSLTPLHMCSMFSYENIFYKEHIKFLADFLNSLEDQTLASLSYRPYPKKNNGLFYDKEKDLLKYLQNGKKEVPLEEKCIFQMHSSHLVIVDYISTAYIEAFKSNIPVIVLFNQKTYLQKDKKNCVFKKLVDAGIFQTNSKKAAILVEKIYKDPRKWWLSEKVQNAVSDFLAKNLNTNNDLYKQINNISKL